MKEHIFTQEERVILLQNKHVAKVTDHSVSFTPAFKKFAVAESVEKGRRPQGIFITEGIPVSIIVFDVLSTAFSTALRRDTLLDKKRAAPVAPPAFLVSLPISTYTYLSGTARCMDCNCCMRCNCSCNYIRIRSSVSVIHS